MVIPALKCNLVYIVMATLYLGSIGAEQSDSENEKALRREKADKAGVTGCPYNARECIRGVASLSKDISCVEAAKCGEDDLIFWCKFAKDNITENPAGVKKICDVLAEKQKEKDPNNPCNEHVHEKCEPFLNVPVDDFHEMKTKLNEDCGPVAEVCGKERLEYWCKTLSGKNPKGMAAKHICTAAGIHDSKNLKKPAEQKGRVAPKGRSAQNQKKGRGLGAKCGSEGKKCTQEQQAANKKVGDGVIGSLKDGLLSDVNLKEVTGTRI